MAAKKFYCSLIVLGIGFIIAVAGWKYASSTPVYSHHHEEAGHDHAHVHDGTTSHDHAHPLMLGTTTHSHPHVHRHNHETPDEIKLEDGLSEIGHVHIDDGVQSYWVKAQFDPKSISVQFWTICDGELQQVNCDEQRLVGMLVVGGRSKDEFLLTKQSGGYVGQIPGETLMLPNNILAIDSVTISGKKFEDLRAPIELAEK